VVRGSTLALDHIGRRNGAPAVATEQESIADA
jgi:hypothetical protein